MNEAYCRRALDVALRRRPFALPAAKARYGPDRPAKVDHIALTLSFDFERKILYGRCATTFTAVGATISHVDLDAAQLTILKASTPARKQLDFDMTGTKLRVA
ncbi:MAG: aminopeptidase, partial [Candidatus Eremiobacterales bacterium]